MLAQPLRAIGGCIASLTRQALLGWCLSPKSLRLKRIQQCRDSEASHGDARVAGDDARTLLVKYGVKWREETFKESVQEMRAVEYLDFPFTPSTCGDYLKAVSHVAESCLPEHNMWIPNGDRAVYEDDCWSRTWP